MFPWVWSPVHLRLYFAFMEPFNRAGVFSWLGNAFEGFFLWSLQIGSGNLLSNPKSSRNPRVILNKGQFGSAYPNGGCDVLRWSSDRVCSNRLERRPGTKNTKPERAGSKSYRVFSRLERTILGRPECSSQSVSHWIHTWISSLQFPICLKNVTCPKIQKWMLAFISYWYLISFSPQYRLSEGQTWTRL